MNGFVTALELIADYSEVCMLLAIGLSIFGGIFAAVVLAVNLLARRWLTSRQMGFLWGLVLIRLAMPFAPESVVSLQNVFVPLVEEASRPSPMHNGYLSSSNSIRQSTQEIQGWPEWGFADLAEWTPPAVSMFESLLNSFWSVVLAIAYIPYLPFLWLGGAITVLTRMLLTHWRFTRQVKRTPISQDARLLQLWDACCLQAGVRRKVPIILFDQVSQPSVMGAVWPKLLLPTDVAELDDDQLRLIMLHELAHIRRQDVAINWLLFSLRLFHWWNPIYWLAASRYCNLREQTCDAMVLRWMSSPAEEKTERDYCTDYSELLLTLAQRPSIASRWKVSLPVSLLGLFSISLRKKTVSNRLLALRRSTTKRHLASRLVAVATVLLITACGLTNAKLPVTNDRGQYDYRPWNEFDYVPEPELTQHSNGDSESIVVKLHSVADLVEKISNKEGCTEDEALQMLKSHVEMLFSSKLPPARLGESILKKYGIEQSFSEEMSQTVNYKATVRANESTQGLVVNAPGAIHEELQQRLKTWRENGITIGKKSGQCQFQVELRFVQISTDIANEVQTPWGNHSGMASASFKSGHNKFKDAESLIISSEPTRARGSQIRTAVLTDKQAYRYMKAAQKDERSNILFAPKVTAFDGREATISGMRYHPFVTGVSRNGAGELVPEKDIIKEGSEITLKPSLSADQSTIHIMGAYDISGIDSVKTFRSTIEGKSASIQIPHVIQQRVLFEAELKDSQHLLIDCFSYKYKNQSFFLMITPYKVKEAALQVSAKKQQTTNN